MPRSRLAFAAAIALNPALGSLYAWSIFLEPLEAALSVQRAELSVVFSVAVVFFTLGMTFGPAVYRVAATPILAATAALLCAAGLAITASASSLPMVIFGYGVLFGSGSGIGYSIMLQAVNLALPHRSGLPTASASACLPADPFCLRKCSVGALPSTASPSRCRRWQDFSY